MAKLQRYQMMLAACAWAALAATAVQPAEEPAVEVKLLEGWGAFEVVSHGPAASLQSAVEVELRTGDHWVNAHVANLHLVAKCEPGTTARCVTLPLGGAMRPVPWRGNYCSSQCPVPCDLDGPVPPGTYRFVVTSCDGKHRFASPSFEKKQAR